MSARLDRTNAVHHVYRCFDAENRLIYVGSSADLFSRLEQHRRTSWWSHQTVRVTAKLYKNGILARRIERKAIREEQPRWNKSGRWSTRAAWRRDQWDDWLLMLLNRGSFAGECRAFVGHYVARWGEEPAGDLMVRVVAAERDALVRKLEWEAKAAQVRVQQERIRQEDELALARDKKRRLGMGIPEDCVCTDEEFLSGEFCEDCDIHCPVVEGEATS